MIAEGNGKIGEMPLSARVCELIEIAPLREAYRAEMRCQIIHDSLHARPGWTKEYVLEMGGNTAGYGSVAIGGPWTNSHTLYEFYIQQNFRQRIFDLFAALLAQCKVSVIETQTNGLFLPTMLHSFTQNIRAEAILFEDRFETQLQPEGAGFRSTATGDLEVLKSLELDESAAWVVTMNDSVVGAGGVLYHYNRPYGDVYMKIAEPFLRKGFGSYLVQELKGACRATGSIPAARCNIANLASRRTLQAAGFVPCGNLIAGDVVQS